MHNLEFEMEIQTLAQIISDGLGLDPAPERLDPKIVDHARNVLLKTFLEVVEEL